MNTTEKRKIQWHPAFCSAVQLVFKKEPVHLEYVREHVLNSKPLLIDLLVVKKPAKCRLDNSLGHLFKGHNLMEYKSPKDSISVDTYFKTYGYACLYKASGRTVNEIRAEDLTISLVRDGKPRELFSFFEKHQYDITNPYPGIYYVKKEGLFDTQVIVSGELDEDEQIWLRVLTPELDQSVLGAFIRKTTGNLNQGWRDLMDSVLEVVLAVNSKKVSLMKKEETEMCEALRELMADEMKEALLVAEKSAEERGMERGMERGIAQGRSKKQSEIALKMLLAGMADEEIMELTEISRKGLEILKDQMSVKGHRS